MSDPAAKTIASEAADPPVMRPLGSRTPPLVPAASAETRALVGVIAILTFLAALCTCAAELVAAAAADWQSAIAREVTIQVRPTHQRDIEADVARAAAAARATAGVVEVRTFSKEEAQRLLEPWLGAGLDLGELPVPRLIALRLHPGGQADLAGLKARLGSETPNATLDDHGLWLSRLSTMARTVVAVAVAIVALVFLAAGLAVAFATRGVVAANREVVDVLHFVGAQDSFIAREFQRRFFHLGLKGGLIGGAAALLLVMLLGWLAEAWSRDASRDQIEALFGAFALTWRSYAGAGLVAAVIAAMAAIVSRATVRRLLRGLTAPARG